MYADKKPENNNIKASKLVAEEQTDNAPSFKFGDDRPKTTVQRKQQELANRSHRATQAMASHAYINSGIKAKLANQTSLTFHNAPSQTHPIQRKENNTGLPDTLKTGLENLSNISLDDVKVYRNSDKPAQLNAHAYAQGSNIHVGPGQEKYLAHEAWHVVQQKQGRVKPSKQLKGKITVNDDVSLEREADIMGARALSFKPTENYGEKLSSSTTQFQKFSQSNADTPIQMGKIKDLLKRKKAGNTAKGGYDKLDDESTQDEDYYNDDSFDNISSEEISNSDTLLDTEDESLELEEDAGFKWDIKEEDIGTSSAQYVKIAKRYHKHVFVVRPEEWGGSSFASLKVELREDLENLPPAAVVDEGETHDKAPLLRNMQGAPKLLSDSVGEGNPEEDSVAQAQKRLRNIVARVRGVLGRLSEDRQEVAVVALAIAQKELDKLLVEHKSWSSTVFAMGAGGPAGYLEEKILPVILSHMSTHLKEFVPMGHERKTRDKMANLGEGAIDISWNAASLGVEALTFGAAAAGTSAVGASYKMGLAGASAKRSGAGYDKAVAQAVVTFVLEFLQGLIPFAGSGFGIASGMRGIYKTINPRKRWAARGGYKTLRDEDDMPDVFAMLAPRIRAAEKLLSVDGISKTRETVSARMMIQQDLEWLRRQELKIDERK